ncbi:MAG: hypothetical protein LUI14_04450 [Lachnospiraceae bacterium]|nr:hypothetical protein [Lachnospiraceae bacterium]
MEKIVSFDSIRKKKSVQGTFLPYDDLDYYNGLLVVQTGIMEELFLETENMLRELGYDASVFSLDKKSAEEFVRTDMNAFAAGDMENLYLIFSADIQGVQYKTYSVANCDNGEVEMETMLLKRDDELGEWLFYDGDSWQQGPGNNLV